MYIYPIKPDEIFHYGIKEKSGRYPWGSGERPKQRLEKASKTVGRAALSLISPTAAIAMIGSDISEKEADIKSKSKRLENKLQKQFDKNEKRKEQAEKQFNKLSENGKLERDLTNYRLAGEERDLEVAKKLGISIKDLWMATQVDSALDGTYELFNKYLKKTEKLNVDANKELYDRGLKYIGELDEAQRMFDDIKDYKRGFIDEQRRATRTR